MVDPLSGFLTGLIGAVPRLVVEWVKSRNTIRVERVRAELAEARDQQNFERTVRLRLLDADLRRRQPPPPAPMPHVGAHGHRTEGRPANSGGSKRQKTPPPRAPYPAGAPSRGSARVGRSGTPAILIGDVPASGHDRVDEVPRRIEALLTEIRGFDARARVVHVAPPVAAAIRHASAARSAAMSFGGSPVIVVFFRAEADGVAAYAHLSTVFDGNSAAESFLVAHYTTHRSAGPVVPGDGDLPSWRRIDLSAVAEVPPADIISYTVTWFLLAVVDWYWTIKNGNNPGLLAQTYVRGAGGPVRGSSPSDRPDWAAHERFTRLEREATELARVGYDVTAEELDGGHMGLHVTGESVDVVFVVGEGYPDHPPVAVHSGATDIVISDSDWNSECTLVEIVEALNEYSDGSDL
jgi:hypothetical protein